MKKTFLFAALAAISMTSCMNEEFPNAPQVSEPGYGYINLNVSNDPVMVTRAEQTVSDLNEWTVTADGETDYELNSLTDNRVKAGTYSITAKNATDINTANSSDGNWGKAYYEKTVEGISVAAGETQAVTIDCGSAKNSKLTLVNSLNTTVFTNVKLHAKKGDNYLEMDGNKSVFYLVGTEVNYYITYTYNTTDGSGNKQTEKTIKNNDADFSINIEQAATDYQITLSSTDNGTINVTLTYNDSFATNNSTTLEFDAATGIQKK